MNSKRL